MSVTAESENQLLTLPRRRISGSYIRTYPLFLLLLLAFAIITYVYYRVSLFYPKSSDQANVLLASLDLVRGNWRLKGWYLPHDGFWTSDILLNALLIKLFSFRPAFLALTPAISWALVVAASMFAACKALPNAHKITATLTVLAVVGAPLMRSDPMYFITLSAIHILSIVYCILCFLALDQFLRNGRVRYLVGYMVLMTAAVIGDPLVIVVGSAPAIAALALATSAPRSKLIGIAATLALVVIAEAALSLNEATGGFTRHTITASFAQFDQAVSNLGVVVHCIMMLFSADFTGRNLAKALPEVVHLPYLALLAASVWSVFAVVVAKANRRATPLAWPEFIPLALAFAIALDIGATALSSRIQGEWTPFGAARYLFPVWIFGAILIARNVAGRPIVAGLAVCAIASSVYADAGLYQATAHAANLIDARDTELLNSLRRHGLRHGIGPYWSSSNIQVAAENQIVMDAGVALNGKIVPFVDTNKPRADFQHLRDFFVLGFNKDECQGMNAVFYSQADVLKTFGPWSDSYTVPCYAVYIYRDG